jgi:CDP-diacylglycerol--glycerol-3-phosphate 3-phosphatidyltransferase
MVFTISDSLYTRIASLLIFIGASLTDLYDGRIARKTGQVTTLGTFLDPLADKFLISAGFIAFVQIPEIHVPAWMVVMIIGREFLITGLRTIAVSKGRILGAQPAGKFKTTSQIVAIITILIILGINSAVELITGTPVDRLNVNHSMWDSFVWMLKGGPYWLTFLTTVLTILSGYIYIKDNVDLFYDEGNTIKK